MITLTRWPRLLLGLLVAGGLAACDKNDNPADDGVTPAAPTVTLGAAPTALTLGAATTLTWSSTDATACAASGAWSGDRPTSGSLANTPAAAGTASYTLTCTGPGGSADATATVTVTAPPAPTVTLSAAPTSIAIGSPTTLTWTSTNAAACTASGAWTGSRSTAGSEASTPATAGTASYTLTCTGPGGSANATATVAVNPLPTVTISAAPSSLTLGAATTLTWSSANATACTASGAWGGSRAVSGSASVTPAATGGIAYTLSCTGPGGSASATATVTVNPVPTVTLNAAPTPITLGSSTTLTWSSSNTTACTASGGWSGARATSGAVSVTPPATGSVSFTLACTGSGGTAMATAVVQVNAVPTVSVTFEGKLSSAGNSSGGPDADGEVAGARIQVIVNGTEFTGTTDIDGNYSVTAGVPENLTQEVSLLIVGRRVLPSGLEIYFLSQLGSFELARNRAGADAVLTADEDFRVNVTPFTTVEVALVREVFEGPIDLLTGGSGARAAGRNRAPAQAKPVKAASVTTPLDRIIDDARRRIDYTQVLAAATTISLVADRGIVPPFGIADAFSLAYYRDVRLAFIDAQQRDNATAYAAAQADALANENTTRRLTAADVPAQVIAAVAADVTEEALYGNGGTYRQAAEITFEAGGGGRYSDLSYSSTAMRWTVNAQGAIEIGFDSAPSYGYTQTSFNPDGTPMLLTCTSSLVAVGVQPIGPDAAIKRDRVIVRCLPEGAAADFDSTYEQAVSLMLPSTLPAFTEADFAGRTLVMDLPLDEAPTILSFSAGPSSDIVDFASGGTGSSRISGARFQWSINADGALDIALSNGRHAVLRPLRAAFEGATHALMVSTLEDGRRHAQGTLIYAYNTDFAFDAATAGTYYFFGVGEDRVNAFVLAGEESRLPTFAESRLLKGIAIQLFPSSVANNAADYLEEAPDGTLTRVVSSSLGSDRGQYWGVGSSGDLIIRRYNRTSGNSGSGCGFAGTDPDCVISDQREITPVFRLGERLGWLERRGSNLSASGTLLRPYTQFVRYYTRASIEDYLLPRTDFSAARPGVPTQLVNPQETARAQAGRPTPKGLVADDVVIRPPLAAPRHAAR